MQSLPLLEVFVQLQRRGLPLGTNEYIAVLDALKKGFGQSRGALLNTCQLVWAKSPEQREMIRDVFTVVFPPVLDTNQIADLLREIDQSSEDQTTKDMPDVKKPEEPRLPAAPQKTDQETTNATEERLDLQWGHGQAKFNIWEPNTIALPVKPTYDFSPRPSVSARQIARSLRYFRNMQRQGSKTEFDVFATIEDAYQKGMFVEPVLVAPRTNAARIMILIDQKGSMKPFEVLLEAFESGVDSSGLQNVAKYYFHDVPIDHIFRDRNLSDGIDLITALRKGNNSSLLIISDAGAARGNIDRKRILATQEFLDTTVSFVNQLAWLNPVPRYRWANTSAAHIAQHHKANMHHFDRQGLFKAIKSLQGVTL